MKLLPFFTRGETILKESQRFYFQSQMTCLTSVDQTKPPRVSSPKVRKCKLFHTGQLQLCLILKYLNALASRSLWCSHPHTKQLTKTSLFENQSLSSSLGCVSWHSGPRIPVTASWDMQSIGLKAIKENSSPVLIYHFIKPQHRLGRGYSSELT